MYSMVEIIKKKIFKKPLTIFRKSKNKAPANNKRKIKSTKFTSSLNNKKIANIKGLCLYKNQYH